MFTPLPLLLLLLLPALGFHGVPFFASANDSWSNAALREGGFLSIKTNYSTPTGTVTQIETKVYVKPRKGFQGVSLLLEDDYDREHLAWFPLTPDDPCLPQKGEWGEMAMGVNIHRDSTPYHLYFWLRYGECMKACEDIGQIGTSPALLGLHVMVHDPSEWRRTILGTSCIIKTLSQSAVPLPSACVGSPFRNTSRPRFRTPSQPSNTPFSHSTTTPTPRPSFDPYNAEAGASDAVMAVVWVVAVVGLVVAAVMMVVPLWWKC